MDSQTVIFIGPQGSGKGTQVKKLADYLSGDGQPIIHLQTGQLFRDMMEEDTLTAGRIRVLMERGDMVPNWLTTAVVVKELEERLTDKTHMLFDGFPRNLEQASVFEDIISFYERTKLTVVYLEVSEAVLEERLKGRGRNDDTDAVIDRRLKLYYRLTEPVVAYYKERANTDFINIDGTCTIAEIQDTIKANFNF